MKYIIVTREPTVSPSLSPSLSPITEVPTVSPTKYIQGENMHTWCSRLFCFTVLMQNVVFDLLDSSIVQNAIGSTGEEMKDVEP